MGIKTVLQEKRIMDSDLIKLLSKGSFFIQSIGYKYFDDGHCIDPIRDIVISKIVINGDNWHIMDIYYLAKEKK